MSDKIPIEIQMEILKRVPVKSLFQFRSVSKLWKSLIDSPQFIADYNACKSRPQRLLVRYDHDAYTGYGFGFDPSYVCIVDDDIFPKNQFRTTFPMTTFFKHLNALKLVGCSQGLLCFLGEYRDDDSYWEIAFVWNPAIRKSIAIDVAVFHEIYPSMIGFGVCPNTSDPMLVRIHDKDFPFHVELFKLSSKEYWRWLHSNLPRRSISFIQSQVAIDRFIYLQTNIKKLIVSFDMISEEFSEINLPQSLASTSTLSISKLRESLAVVEYDKEAEKPVCSVWMMEHGAPKSFTKLFTITTPNAYLRKVLAFRKNGEVILEAKIDEDYEPAVHECYEPAVLEVYEPRSKVIKDLGIYGEHRSFFVSSYTESLLLLDQADNQHLTCFKKNNQRIR